MLHLSRMLSDRAGMASWDINQNRRMKSPFSATVWLERDCFVFQCLDVYSASQGSSKEEAFANLREAPELYWEDSESGAFAERSTPSLISQ